MTDELDKDKDEEREGDLPVGTPLAEDETDTHDDDAFLEGFGEESLDPEEADALAMGYRIRGGNSEEDDEDIFSAENE